MTRFFALALAAAVAVAALGVAALGRDRPALDAGGRQLTDAVTIAVTSTGSEAVRLRLSDPTRDMTCVVPLSDFSGDGPAVGEVVPVVPGPGNTCELAELTGVLPRGSLVLTALLCLAGILGYAATAARKRHRRRGQDDALIRYLSQHPGASSAMHPQ